MKEYLYQFIPDRFSYLTENKKIQYKDKFLKSDYIINLIHEFIMKYFFSNDISSLRVNLWSLILRKKYGMYYSYYIKYLIDEGFITLVSDYFVSKKSKTYKINYFDIGSLKRVKIYDKILLKKYSKDYLERNITDFNNSPIPLNIRRKLIKDIYSTVIDYNKSLSYLNDLKSKGSIDSNKYYKNLMSINGIKDRHLFFKFDSYGRLHSNYTILKKEIRKEFLKMDNDDVCELDIKNSQPFFLSLMMKKYIVHWKELEDVERYFFVVNNGIIYDDILDRYKELDNRKDAKMLVYKVLFGKNLDNSKYSKIFKKLYPNVYSFIKNYKENKGDHKIMSHELQKIESEFIFNNVVSKIMKKNSKIKVISIHDSLIFPCKYEKEVSEIFYKELNKLKIIN